MVYYIESLIALLNGLVKRKYFLLRSEEGCGAARTTLLMIWTFWYTNSAILDEFLLPLTILVFQGKRSVTRNGEIRASL